ncbi:MAG: acyl-CoA dehydrogenase [Rhodobacteraceae bacterium]|nr:acyl-CoA dehydrogenase [Paracoccaceae bacterium]
MTYRAPIAEIEFMLNEVLGADQLTQTTLFEDVTEDLRSAILREAAKLSEEVLAPLNVAGDLTPAKLENGVTRCSPGFADGYRAVADGGWVGMAAKPESGGMGLPMTLLVAVNEMMSSACLSLALNPLMTQGQIEALEYHASDEIKAVYLDKLISGQWTGTMNLTEAQAGSDVGALSTKASDNGDGSFAITGQKIFISWGDHDVAENICHLVLARLPDGAAGTRGISLFIVPKFIPDENGNPGVANTLHAVSLEHKMGLHGSPTAVMAFDGAKGWMIGAENGGMAAMFTMMNNARLGVGIQGLSQAEAAFQKALAYAGDRKQGKSLVENGTGTIVDHADVRRNLMTMKTLTLSARAICLDTALSLDLSRALDGAEAEKHKARAAFLTPIAKAFSTDIGCQVAELGVQVHGGMGYIEEAGASQFYRDVRVTAIYEGTNGIQAMDLVGRKMKDGGTAAHAILAEITATAADAAPDVGNPLAAAVNSLTEATQYMLQADMNDRFAGAAPYLRAFALALAGHYLLKSALKDPTRMPLARFHIRQTMQQVDALCSAAREGATTLYALDMDGLAR